jgi:hypothetical protein
MIDVDHQQGEQDVMIAADGAVVDEVEAAQQHLEVGGRWKYDGVDARCRT